MFKNNKKAQGLSINTIIIAAIAVVVLVVLIAIFTGRIGMFSTALSGTANAEKSKDAITNDCIPADSYYAKIGIEDDALSTKANQLTSCKDSFAENKENCISSLDCQWVGS